MTDYHEKHHEEKWKPKEKRKPRIPAPELREQLKIKRSLGLKRYDKFPKCPAQSRYRARKAQEDGTACEDCGKAGKSPCEKCRCTHVAGQGTEHYGVGFCWNHSSGLRAASAEKFADNHRIALQQGYPMKPVRYLSKNDILLQIQEEEVEAREKISTMRELDLLRSKMQEFEDKCYNGTLTTYKNGELVEASDEDKINMTAKLTNSIAKVAKLTLDITDQDYIHVNEIKLWLSAIVTMTRNEIKDEAGMERWLRKLMEIPQPTAGKKGARK